MEIQINYSQNNLNITYNITKDSFMNGVENSDFVRYLKGVFTNKGVFKDRFINEMKKPFKITKNEEFNINTRLEDWLKIYDEVSRFSYEEAFKISDRAFQALVFGSVNIGEMIKELGSQRLKTDGKMVNHKQYSPNGEFLGYKEYNNIYEVYEVNGEKLGLNEKLYALKCWCTSTNKEHWLWIEDKFKDSPLEAVASTFRIHENLIPHIKEIKRQGDVLLVEMKENVEPSGEIVPLTAEQYFSLLTAQA